MRLSYAFVFPTINWLTGRALDTVEWWIQKRCCFRTIKAGLVFLIEVLSELARATTVGLVIEKSPIWTFPERAACIDIRKIFFHAFSWSGIPSLALGASKTCAICQHKDGSIFWALLANATISTDDIGCLDIALRSVMAGSYFESFIVVFFNSRISQNPVACIQICDINVLAGL